MWFWSVGSYVPWAEVLSWQCPGRVLDMSWTCPDVLYFGSEHLIVRTPVYQWVLSPMSSPRPRFWVMSITGMTKCHHEDGELDKNCHTMIVKCVQFEFMTNKCSLQWSKIDKCTGNEPMRTLWTPCRYIRLMGLCKVNQSCPCPCPCPCPVSSLKTLLVNQCPGRVPDVSWTCPWTCLFQTFLDISHEDIAN